MKSETMKMTVAEFAGLHGVNKRTLHYYDNIGLFSPRHKGENQYRYYDYMQSIEFEYIHMLKELNMSIEEIKTYMDKPCEEEFLKLADRKMIEIDMEIRKLRKTRHILENKKQQVILSREIEDCTIKIVECEEERYLMTVFTFEEDDLEKLAVHINDVWGIEQYRMGVGSYISTEKIKSGDFENYDGLFTPAQKGRGKSNVKIRPKGKYLYAWKKGNWDKLPELYREILKYTEEKEINLTGNAYEIGLNDFAIADMNEYVTQVMIRIENF